MKRENNKALPGRVDCAVNFGLKETTLHIHRLPKVEKAREEVLQQTQGGVLRLQVPEWNVPTQLRGPKYARTSSDLSLNNLLTAGIIKAKDFRKTACTAYHPQGTYHAFTRGDVTTGWNHSTSLTRLEKQQWQQQLDTKATQHTLKVSQKLGSRYISPPKREEDFAMTQRTLKETRCTTQRYLLARYGPEGGSAAIAAQQLTQSGRRVRIRTTLADLEAVRSLPEEVVSRGRARAEGEEGEEDQDRYAEQDQQ